MSEEKTTHYHENIAAYTLGALDQDEALQLETHLANCEACQQELAEYQAVSNELLKALPPLSPSPKVRERLAARLPQGEPTPSTRSVRPKLQLSFWRPAAALAFVILIGLNTLSFIQIRSMRQQQAELASQIDLEQSAIAMLAHPGTEIIPAAENGNGRLLLNTDMNTAILVAQNFPELPEDSVYQIWLIDPEGGRVSGGLFTSSTELAYKLVEVDPAYVLSEFVALGVTIEPWGGSPGPTGANVFKVNF